LETQNTNSNMKGDLVRDTDSNAACWRSAKDYACDNISSKVWLTYALPVGALRESGEDFSLFRPSIRLS
jgi:hypothetical protein